ncbi:DEAD/DEAH box helicase [Candidatus Woesearchaeota archaeon]|nr:DEAD/DEAH box helicase [Candidatus Woesearchaeota archaeon]
MLRNFTPRLYQQTILGTAAAKNTLVVLPTGLGKTAIAFLMTAQRLHHYPDSKILMLAPTKPLCEQHQESFRQHLDVPPEKIVLFTGSVNPQKRAAMWKEAQIIISTPQGLENDLINNRINLKETSLLILDEAHHATGDYSYVWVAQQYEKLSPHSRILALTASPGADMEKIREVCQNLHIEKVEVRTENDSDVKPYIQRLNKNWITVKFPDEFLKIRQHLLDCAKSKLQEAQKNGYCGNINMTKGELLGLQRELQAKISGGEREFELLRSVSLIAEALKVEHGLELLETQGLEQLYAYLKKLQTESLTSKVKAVQNLVRDLNFKSAFYLAEELKEKKIEHPKLQKLKEILLEELAKKNTQGEKAKAIVFTQFRSSAEQIVNKLTEAGISNHIFVGQAKKNGVGFSQKQQKEILDKFRAGEFQVLIATSVAEEGLDIPKVDKVIFFEAVPSAIRSIQRRGRTGRLEQGEVDILIATGTRDEAYRWSAHHKEKSMFRNLETMKKEFALLDKSSELTVKKEISDQPKENTLDKYVSQDKQPSEKQQSVVAILADHREKDNKVVKELIELGFSVRTEQLISADYLISGKVAVELKKVPDFVASLLDGRLLTQARELRQNFEKAVLVIEGEEDIYTVRKVHPNAIRGMLAALVLDFRIPVLYTKNPQETAALIGVMAKREQDTSRDFSLHERKPRSLKEQQEFLVSAFPGIGVLTARNLLNYFGTIKKLVNATKAELVALDGVGEKTAERLIGLWEEEYGKEWERNE